MIIRATCPSCGDVEVRRDQLEIELAGFSFTCAECGARVARPAERNVLELLAGIGVRPAAGIPAEVFEPRCGPALTEADARRFQRLLDDDDWFDQLVELIEID